MDKGLLYDEITYLMEFTLTRKCKKQILVQDFDPEFKSINKLIEFFLQIGVDRNILQYKGGIIHYKTKQKVQAV